MSIGSLVLVGFLLAALSPQQEPPPPPRKLGEPVDVRLPSGKLQRDEILKDQHRKSLQDIKELLEVAGQLQSELEKDDYLVLSIQSLKKTERIEKLARQIRSRLRR